MSPLMIGTSMPSRIDRSGSTTSRAVSLSSIEVFETDTLEHVESHSFGIFGGSATWVDRADGHWWVAFAHYAGFGGVPDQGPAWTNLVKFDERWRRVAGYVYPRAVVERFQQMSNSGGAWGE